MSLTLHDTTELTSGHRMPMLGFGTWKLGEGSAAREAVGAALELGYRHVDTAAAYENERSVGEAVRDSGIRREEVFVTTKAWTDDIRGGYDAVLSACEESLRRLGLEYVDLYLLHWPVGRQNCEAWRALEFLYHNGKARSIGVCNYLPHHLESLLAGADIAPMVDQIEFHPRLLQPDLAAACSRHGIVREAWSPLMQGHVGDVPEIVGIARRHGRTPEQVVLRWDLQQQVATIPRSSQREHIAGNAALFDFELTPDDLMTLNHLDCNRRFGPNPDHIGF